MSNITNVCNTNYYLCFAILAFLGQAAIFAYEMQLIMNILQHQNIRPGDGLVRSKSFLGLIDHYGLYVGQFKVIENHPLHGVRLISLAEFLDGRKLQRVKTFPGSDWSRSNAVQKAYEMIGTHYDVLDFNCEHFVNHIHNLGVKSGQADLAKGLVFGVLALGLISVIAGD